MDIDGVGLPKIQLPFFSLQFLESACHVFWYDCMTLALTDLTLSNLVVLLLLEPYCWKKGHEKVKFEAEHCQRCLLPASSSDRSVCRQQRKHGVTKSFRPQMESDVPQACVGIKSTLSSDPCKTLFFVCFSSDSRGQTQGLSHAQ